MTFCPAFFDGLERSEDKSVVGRTAAGERETRNRECAEDVGIGSQDLFCLLRDASSVGERSSLRRLHHDDEIVLILLRNEAGGNVHIHIARRG